VLVTSSYVARIESEDFSGQMRSKYKKEEEWNERDKNKRHWRNERTRLLYIRSKLSFMLMVSNEAGRKSYSCEEQDAEFFSFHFQHLFFLSLVILINPAR
jgi:hypothetical protein